MKLFAFLDLYFYPNDECFENKWGNKYLIHRKDFGSVWKLKKMFDMLLYLTIFEHFFQMRCIFWDFGTFRFLYLINEIWTKNFFDLIQK